MRITTLLLSLYLLQACKTGTSGEDTDTDTAPGAVVAVDDVFVVAEGWVETMDLALNDVGTGLEVLSVGEADYGEVSVSAGVVTYAPAPGYLGPAVFTYVVADAQGTTDDGMVSVDVVPAISESQGGFQTRPWAKVGGLHQHLTHESSEGTSRLVLRESADGLTWGEKSYLFPSPEYQAKGSLLTWIDPATQETVLGVSWREQDPITTNVQFWFSRRVGEGGFSAPAQITDLPAVNYTFGSSAVSFGDGELLWVANTSGPNPSEVRRNRSVDGGLTWTAETTFGSTGYYGTVNSVLADGDTVYVVTSADRYYKRTLEMYVSTDRGVTFGEAIDITGYTFEQDWTADFATLALAPDGDLHLVWEQITPLDNTTRVFHTSSADGGATWAEFAQVSDPDAPSPDYNGYPDLKPRISFGGDDRVYVLWGDTRLDNDPIELGDRNMDVWLSSSTDGGASWSADLRVNDRPELYFQRGNSLWVEPGADTDCVLVSWRDERFDTDGVAPIYTKLLYTALTLP